MSAPRLYEITTREVSSVSDLLKAIVEVNWHLAAAEEAGWSITLDVEKGSGRLGIAVARTEGWPCAESEAEAEGVAA